MKERHRLPLERKICWTIIFFAGGFWLDERLDKVRFETSGVKILWCDFFSVTRRPCDEVVGLRFRFDDVGRERRCRSAEEVWRQQRRRRRKVFRRQRRGESVSFRLRKTIIFRLYCLFFERPAASSHRFQRLLVRLEICATVWQMQGFLNCRLFSLLQIAISSMQKIFLHLKWLTIKRV